jgi:hypothetical protein
MIQRLTHKHFILSAAVEMATLNSFDILGTNDNDDPSQLMVAVA